MVAPKSKSQEQIETLHAAYKRLTKMDVGLRFNRESSWYEFVRQGFTEADLEAVVARLLALIKIGERKPECLKFSNLIEALDRFEEELAMTKVEDHGIKAGVQPLSVWEVKETIEFIQQAQQDLVDRYANESATGIEWKSTVAMSKFYDLQRKRTALQDLIISK